MRVEYSICISQEFRTSRCVDDHLEAYVVSTLILVLSLLTLGLHSTLLLQNLLDMTTSHHIAFYPLSQLNTCIASRFPTDHSFHLLTPGTDRKRLLYPFLELECWDFQM
jgi:hypothetical protein